MPFESSITRHLLVIALLLGAVAVMAINVAHPGRAQRLERQAESQAHLEALLVTATQHTDRLAADIAALEQGSNGWQALARTEYGMLLPGEVLYRFPAPTP